MEHSSPGSTYRLGMRSWWAAMERDLEFYLMASWMWVSTLPWLPKGPSVLWVHQAQWVREGIVPSALLYVASPETQGSVLGATIYKGHKTIRDCPKESYRDSERSGGQDVWGVAEAPWFVLCRGDWASWLPTAPHREQNDWGGCLLDRNCTFS